MGAVATLCESRLAASARVKGRGHSLTVSSQSVVLLDYGAGNLTSLVSSLRALGTAPRVATDASHAKGASHLLVPGVGSFLSALTNLRESRLDEVILEAQERGQPILGICVGMQLLCGFSDEDGGHSGLGAFPGRLEKFAKSSDDYIRVPHVGFNSISDDGSLEILKGIEEGSDFYFAHSYRWALGSEAQPLMIASTNYGGDFVSACRATDRPTFGVQFHPELSQGNGLILLRNFLEI